MSRPQPRTARPWLLRGLLVLLTLTGLGVWQGGHCIDDAPAHHPASVAALSAASATTPAAAERGTTAAATMPAHHHRDMHASELPGTSADSCHIAPTTVTRTTMTAALMFPAVQRAAPVAASSPSSTPRCFSPGVALTRLGVSRT